MQKSLIASLILLGSTPALAGSFETQDLGETSSGAIITIGCPICTINKAKAERAAKMLPPGTEINEIREVDGELLLYTTDNWLGGNPVTFVRKAHALDIAKYSPKDAVAPKNAVADAESKTGNPNARPVTLITANAASGMIDLGVDKEAKTSALPEEPKTFDASGLKLRTELQSVK